MNKEEEITTIKEMLSNQEKDLKILTKKITESELELELLKSQTIENSLANEEIINYGSVACDILHDLKEFDEVKLSDFNELIIFSDRLFTENYKIEFGYKSVQLIIPESKVTSLRNFISNLKNLEKIEFQGVTSDVPEFDNADVIKKIEIHTQVDNLENLNLRQFTNARGLEIYNAQFNREDYELSKLKSFNYISNLSGDIKELTKLESIKLSTPLLREISDIFSEMKELKTFVVDYSNLKKLPASFYKLSNLTSLKIKSYDLLELNSLECLKELQVLDLLWVTHDYQTDMDSEKPYPFDYLKNIGSAAFPDKIKRFFCLLYDDNVYRRNQQLKPYYSEKELEELRERFVTSIVIKTDPLNNYYRVNDLATYYTDDFPTWLEKNDKLKTIILIDYPKNKKIPDYIAQMKKLELIYTNLDIESLEMSEKVKEFIKPKLKNYDDKKTFQLVSLNPVFVTY